MPRPEVQAPPEIFYNESEARKYTTSSRIIEIQASYQPPQSCVRFELCQCAVLMRFFLCVMFDRLSGEDFREGAGVACSPQRWRPQAASRHRSASNFFLRSLLQDISRRIEHSTPCCFDKKICFFLENS